MYPSPIKHPLALSSVTPKPSVHYLKFPSLAMFRTKGHHTTLSAPTLHAGEQVAFCCYPSLNTDSVHRLRQPTPTLCSPPRPPPPPPPRPLCSPHCTCSVHQISDPSMPRGLKSHVDYRTATLIFVEVNFLFQAVMADVATQKVVQWYRACLSTVLANIHEYQGEFNKLCGNKLMLSFGATRRIAAHCAKALEAAWRMSSDLADLETSMDSQGGATPSIAVVHGKVACGIMGTDTQRDVSIVGLPVIRGSMLASLNRSVSRPYHIRPTPVPHQHHIRTTSGPHPYPIRTTSVPHPHHIRTTSVPHHIRPTSVPHPQHMRTASVPHRDHIRPTSIPHPYHIRRTASLVPHPSWHFRTTSAPHPLYHIRCGTSAPHPYHIRTTSLVPHLLWHIRTTSAPHPYHICTTSVPHPDHIRPTSIPHPCHMPHNASPNAHHARHRKYGTAVLLDEGVAKQCTGVMKIQPCGLVHFGSLQQSPKPELVYEAMQLLGQQDMHLDSEWMYRLQNGEEDQPDARFKEALGQLQQGNVTKGKDLLQTLADAHPPHKHAARMLQAMGKAPAPHHGVDVLWE